MSTRLRNIRSLCGLIPFLRDELDLPIESEDPEKITFDYGFKTSRPGGTPASFGSSRSRFFSEPTAPASPASVNF